MLVCQHAYWVVKFINVPHILDIEISKEFFLSCGVTLFYMDAVFPIYDNASL
jgi:hypothetical protein